MAQNNSSNASPGHSVLGQTAQTTNGSHSLLSSQQINRHGNDIHSVLDLKKARFQYAKTVADTALHTSDRLWFAIMLQEASMARSEETGTFSAMDSANERRLDAVASVRLMKDSTRNAQLAVETVENVSTALLNVGRYLTGHETKDFKKDDTLTLKRIDQSLNQPFAQDEFSKYREHFGEKTVRLNTNQLEHRIQTFREDNAALKRQISDLTNPTALPQRDINKIRGFISTDGALTDAHRKEINSIIRKNTRMSDKDKGIVTNIISNNRNLHPFEVNKLDNVLTKRTPLTQSDREHLGELLVLKKERDKELRSLISFSHAKKVALKEYEPVAKIHSSRQIETLIGRVDRINHRIDKEIYRAAIANGYDPKIDARMSALKKSIRRSHREAIRLSDNIADFYTKGSNLSVPERQHLIRNIRHKREVDTKLRGLASEYKQLRSKKCAQSALLSRPNLLNSAEMKRLSKLRENLRLYKARESIRKAHRGKYQIKRSFVSLVSSAARESEEAGVQGLLRANRLLQSRFARPVLVDFHKMALTPAKIVTKPVRSAVSMAAHGVDQKFHISFKAKRLASNTKMRVKYSKPSLQLRRSAQQVQKELNGGIYHRAKRGISSVTPDKVKVGARKVVTTKNNTLHYISNKHRVFEKWRNKVATKFNNSFLGKALTRAKTFFKRAHQVASLGSFALKRTLSIVLLSTLLIAVVGVILTSSSNLASSIILSDKEKDGKIDLTPYGEILNEAQKKWYEELDEFVADSKKHYYQVHVEYLNDAATNNFKEIISMAAVYFGQNFDNEANVKDYLCYLYEISHYYETEEIHGISCDGCETETTYCTGCVKDDYGLTCPGHNEVYCPGNHIRLNVQLMVLGFDDIFWADNYAGGGTTSSGGMYKGELIGENFTITGYCSCTICCGQYSGGPTASGVMPQANHTIAVDPDVIPLGTHVIINGKEYVAEDIGGAIKGNRIDMYFNSHQEALNWGKRYYDVYYATSSPGESSTTRSAIDYSQYSLAELKIFMSAKELELERFHGQLLGDEFELTVEALNNYDNEHINDQFTTAELNAFVYIDMSKNELQELCDNRGISYLDTESENSLILSLVEYDLVHPDNDPIKGADEITVGSGEGSNGLLFEGWTELNVEWAKLIYQNMTDELYTGLESLEGSYNSSDGFSGYEITEGSTAVMYYSQYDSRWKDSAYGSSTIGKSGCGPTSMAMVISSLTNTTLDPVQMCNWSSSNGYYVSGVGTSWSFISGAASNWGLTCQQVSKSEVQAVINALSSGKLVVMSTGPGTYYQGQGHFLVLRGVTADGKILVADPASEEKTQKAWSVSDITSGLKAWWIIGR